MTTRERSVFRAGWACALAGAWLLAACSSVNWERAFYEGFRSNAARADPARREPPPQTLPPYDAYEAQRQRLASDGAASQPGR
jgi:hypothetical protein